MRTALRYLRSTFVAPLVNGQVPPGHLSRGAGIGLGIALLPLVGQMSLIPVLWAALRPVGRFRFHLPAAMAMAVLISPPLKIPLFYGYLLSGEALLALAGFHSQRDSHHFIAQWSHFSNALWMGRFEATGRILRLAVERYGLPLGVGGVVWATLLGGTAWAISAFVLTRRKTRLVKPSQA